jgi:hypothetical protein
LVAAATIAAADGYGLPVSTTHVLSSGVAGILWRVSGGGSELSISAMAPLLVHSKIFGVPRHASHLGGKCWPQEKKDRQDDRDQGYGATALDQSVGYLRGWRRQAQRGESG